MKRRERTVFVPNNMSNPQLERGMGFTSIREREQWKHREARVHVGLPAEELPINPARDRLEVTLTYATEPPAITHRMQQEARKAENFELLRQQESASEESFVDGNTRLAVREDQQHRWRMVDGPSRVCYQDQMRLDNRSNLHSIWQPKLDAKYDASERMARPVAEDRTYAEHPPTHACLFILRQSTLSSVACKSILNHVLACNMFSVF